MSSFWKPTMASIWTGRDDSAEGINARRVYQDIKVIDNFEEKIGNKNVLIGFACDKGIERNQGRLGAAKAPDILRSSLANFATQGGHNSLVDYGTVYYQKSLEETQRFFAEIIRKLQSENNKTVVLGGGHETAYAHGLGVFIANPNMNIGIINFDAHLDMRVASEPTSGTPFYQLEQYCKSNNRPFNYFCIGASEAANTKALLDVANNTGVDIIWDYDCHFGKLEEIKIKLQKFIDQVDLIYLSFDYDALPASDMFAVSAPSSLGVDPLIYLILGNFIKNSEKLVALDFVEYSPCYDRDYICAKLAARYIWEFTNNL